MWWKKKKERKEITEEKKSVIEVKKEESLLQELCGDDVKLCDLLGNYLILDPLAGISTKDLDTLTEEAEKSGFFRSALDKAIFEASQNPGERERYIKAIQDLVLKTIYATEQDKEKVEKEGLTDRAASLGKRIEDQKFISERTEDILNVASEFYNERLVELGEKVRREARGAEKKGAEWEEWRTGQLEKASREARKKEVSKMGKEERREAKEQDRIEELAAEERKEARAEERREADRENERIEEMEKTEREARKKERSGN